MTTKSWHKIAEISLGDKICNFGFDNFTFGLKSHKENTLWDFFRTPMYPLDQVILKKINMDTEKIFKFSGNVTVVQIYQLLNRNKKNFLNFLFDYFHWVENTYLGQKHFVSEDFIVELIYCLFFFNCIPITKQFIALNLQTMLATVSHEGRDIYEYYKYLDPIKKEKRPDKRRKKLLEWIKYHQDDHVGDHFNMPFNQTMKSETNFATSNMNMDSVMDKSKASSHYRSQSLSGFSGSRGSIFSSKSYSLSEITIKNKQNKKRKKKTFDCFHCNEEIKAKKHNDGLFRNIFRPGMEGFGTGVHHRNEMISAFVVVSKTEDIVLNNIFQPLNDHSESHHIDKKKDISNLSSKKTMKTPVKRTSRFSQKQDSLNLKKEDSHSNRYPLSHLSVTYRKSTRMENLREGSTNSIQLKKYMSYEVIDISKEFSDLLEQASLFLERNELPLTDKNGELVVIQEILSHKKKLLSEYNKLVIIDNRLKGRIFSVKFDKFGNCGRLFNFKFGDIRRVYPKSFIFHLIYYNRMIHNLFNNSK